MIIPPDHRIEDVAAKATDPQGERRPALQNVHLTTVDGARFLEATDSYVWARVPVQAEGDVDGNVEADVVREHRRYNVREAQQDKRLGVPYEPTPLLLHGDRLAYCDRHGARIERNLTDTEQSVFPDAEHYAANTLEAYESFSVGVNVKALAKAAAALGTDVVKLTFIEAPGLEGAPSARKPIRITGGPGTEAGAVAIMMPVRLP